LVKILGCSYETSVMLGPADREHPRLTNGEIIFEDFQPITSTSQTDRHTDDLP